MQLVQPWSLLWLGLLVPVIVFFYLLKLRRREVVISSVLLWSQLVKDVQANAPFQKLKKNLLLYLQLLAVALAILGLARPAVLTRSLGGANVVVILDGSASMQSRDAQGSRFDAARAAALKMVANMRGGDRMMLLLATGRTQRLTGFTSDRGELRRALARAAPQDTTTNLRDALLLAASVAANSIRRSGNRIYVFSDGAFEDLDAFDPLGSEVQFVRFGSRSENLGIVAMDVRRAFRERGGYQLFVAVRNHSSQPKKTNIEFYRDDALIDARALELPAADPKLGFSEKAEVFDNIVEANGVLQARLDARDDLEADNRAFTQLSARREVNVLLVSEGDTYLERALVLDPRVQVSRVTPSGYVAQSGFDVVVFENAPPREVGPGNHLYINCAGPTAPVQVRGKLTDASILDWDRVHPVMRYVKLGRLGLAEALTVQDKPWAVRLAEHEGGTAIAVGENGGVKSAFVSFPLLKTEFPLRVAFPIFFNNMIQWLAASPGRNEGLQLRTGQAARLETLANLQQVTVTFPDGSKAVSPTEGRFLNFSDTEQAGVYRVDGSRFHAEFAANLLSRDESATLPRDRIQLGNRPLLASTGYVSSWEELWRWLVLVALVVLGLEWWVFHRRI